MLAIWWIWLLAVGFLIGVKLYGDYHAFRPPRRGERFYLEGRPVYSGDDPTVDRAIEDRILWRRTD